MSIVRVGLAETKKFAQGYDAIFRKRAGGAAGSKAKTKAKAKTGKGRKKTAKRR